MVGAVLGQPGGSLGPNTAAVDAGDALVKSVFAALHSFTVFTPGQKVAEVDAAWGGSAPVTVARPVNVVGWPGLTVTIAARAASLHGALPVGAFVGTLHAIVGSRTTAVELRTSGTLPAPSVWWRLTR